MTQHSTLLASKPAIHTEEGSPLSCAAVNEGPDHAVQPAVPSMNTMRFGHDFSRVPVRLGSTGIIQPKLRFSQPGDRSEREADRIADAVMRTPGPPQAARTEVDRSLAPLVQRQDDKTDQGPPVAEQQDEGGDEAIAVFVESENQEPLEEETEGTGTVQLKEACSGPEPTRPSLHPSALTASNGRPIAQNLRSDMEQRFGAGFGAIRLHTDERSDALCRSIGARAFTYQNHIHLAENEYTPSTAGGRHLLAHELTHTLQQGAADSVDAAPSAAQVQPQAALASGAIQRAIDLSTQFDTYSLAALQGAVPLTGGAVSRVLRGMENTAYASFGARAPVTSMSVRDKWYFYNPPFTNSVNASRSLFRAKLSNYSFYGASDVHRFTFNYSHSSTRQRLGSFSVSSGTSRSKTTTLTGGAKLSYSVLELSASASRSSGSGSTAGTTATTTNFYEHDYDVSLTYNSQYYKQSDFVVRRGFFGPRMYQVGGPHTLSGTVRIGSCTLKDDDSNPDNLTP